MKSALNSIINQLIGIDYQSLTQAEKNILHIAAGALSLTIKIKDGTITLEKK